MRMPKRVISNYFINSGPIKAIICPMVIGVILFSTIALAMTVLRKIAM